MVKSRIPAGLAGFLGAIRPLLAAAALAILLPGLAACSSSAEKAAQIGAEAQQLFDAKDMNGARTQIAAAISERDDMPELYILQGRIELASGNAANAFQAYSRALSLESTNPEALQAVSQLGLQTGHLREAEKAADTILTFNAAQPGALLVKGLVAFARRKHDTAIEYADQILAVQPENEGGLILKARSMAVSGDMAGALETLQTASESGRATEGIDLTILELYRSRANLPGMLATFERIIDSGSAAGGPRIGDVKLDYANTLYKSGNAPKARQQLRDLVRQDPPDLKLLTSVTALWEEYDPAPLTEADMAYLSKEGTVAARLAIARYFLNGDRPGDARRVLQSISTGYWPEARALYARALFALGQQDEAAQIASAILAKDETNADALLVRSRSYMAKKDFVRSINDAQIVVRDNPEFADGYLALAQAYIAEGDSNGARRTLDQAAKLLPQNRDIFEFYGNFLLDNGATGRALAAMRKFARDTPASAQAWQLYAAICRRTGPGPCAQQASEGERIARSIYAIDLPPGSPPTRGLFGRLE